MGYKIHSLWREVLEGWGESEGRNLYLGYLCIYIYILSIYSLFIYLFIYSLAHCQVGQVGLSRERAWILEDVHFITSAFPAPVVKFISARFPTLQTIAGTRLHVLSLTDDLCNHLFV